MCAQWGVCRLMRVTDPSDSSPEQPTLAALREACGRGAAVQIRLESGAVWATLLEVRGGRSPVVVVSVSGVTMEGSHKDVIALRA